MMGGGWGQQHSPGGLSSANGAQSAAAAYGALDPYSAAAFSYGMMSAANPYAFGNAAAGGYGGQDPAMALYEQQQFMSAIKVGFS
jgi:hypothetical protein